MYGVSAAVPAKLNVNSRSFHVAVSQPRGQTQVLLQHLPFQALTAPHICKASQKLLGPSACGQSLHCSFPDTLGTRRPAWQLHYRVVSSTLT